MNEKYKQLMLFHILTAKDSYPEARYAAVDQNGHLWCYYTMPVVINPHTGMWKNMDIKAGLAGRVANISKCEFWGRR